MTAGARKAAFLSLIRAEKSGSYTNLEIDSKIKKFGLAGAERALYTALVYGVTERRITLDFRLAPLVSGGLDRLASEVLCILRLGAYQIIYLDRVPNSAAVNESVILAKEFAPRARGLVNAVLRSLCRTLDDPPALPDDPVLRAEIEYGVPRGIIALWNGCYGEEKTREILDGLSRRPLTALRVNTLKTTPEALASRLAEGGYTARPGDAESSLILSGPGSPETLRAALEDGLCFVQDLSSQTAVGMLGVREGDFVIDCCCCPGGKTFAAALATGGRGSVRAFDLHENKLSLVSRTAERLGVGGIIGTAARDARDPDPALYGKADRVICDVPCSGLGVIAKKPEIRYRALESAARLPELQLAILAASSRYLKSGGRLLYSTCTLNGAENGGVTAAFLESADGFSLIGERTFFPTPQNDGFYAAVIEKK